jgi:hypothetical protein
MRLYLKTYLLSDLKVQSINDFSFHKLLNFSQKKFLVKNDSTSNFIKENFFPKKILTQQVIACPGPLFHPIQPIPGQGNPGPPYPQDPHIQSVVPF